MKNTSNKSCRKIKTHVLCPVTFSENRAVYEEMSKNVVEPERLHMAIWRRIACLIIKATRVQTHASVSAPRPTRMQTHARTHTHKYIILTACLLHYGP